MFLSLTITKEISLGKGNEVTRDRTIPLLSDENIKSLILRSRPWVEGRDRDRPASEGQKQGTRSRKELESTPPALRPGSTSHPHEAAPSRLNQGPGGQGVML